VKAASAFASIAALAMSACSCTSDGLELPQKTVRTLVTFDWRGIDELSGALTAGFANGPLYQGLYFQIANESRVDRLHPLGEGWTAADRVWRDWRAEAAGAFVERYSGRVVTNLSTASGERMRCRFRLARPSAGMAGGGEGVCQIGGGKTIDVAFPRAPRPAPDEDQRVPGADRMRNTTDVARVRLS
jgi:hypothetical protein